jgi:hypothetical protein
MSRRYQLYYEVDAYVILIHANVLIINIIIIISNKKKKKM